MEAAIAGIRRDCCWHQVAADSVVGYTTPGVASSSMAAIAVTGQNTAVIVPCCTRLDSTTAIFSSKQDPREAGSTTIDTAEVLAASSTAASTGEGAVAGRVFAV